MEKYGFVYIWYNKEKKKYYIGSHWGAEDDGYICSSTWMRNSYRRHPQDFKRRILKRIYTNRIDTFLEEEKYLKMIKPEELRKRYYNISSSIKDHWSQYPEKVLKLSQKISRTLTGRKHSDETKAKMSATRMGHTTSDHVRKKASETHKGKFVSEETRKKMSDSRKGFISYNKGVSPKKEECSRLARMAKDYKWINDGEKNSKIHKDNSLPEGWKYGRFGFRGITKQSEEVKKRISASLKGHKLSEETKRKISETKRRMK